MDELLEQFVVESRELAEQATAGLLQLEHAPQDVAVLDAVFRALHTLKGGAGIVEFDAMERAMHAAEDLLGIARGGRRQLEPVSVGLCLACVDHVLQWMEHIEATGQLPGNTAATQADQLIARLQALPPVAEPASVRVDAAAAPGATASATDAPRFSPETPVGAAAAPTPLNDRARAVLAAQLALVGDAAAIHSRGHLASAARTAANALRASGMQDEALDVMALAPAGDWPADTAGLEHTARQLQLELERLLQQPSSGAAEDPGACLPGAGPTAAAGSAGAPRTLRVDASRIDALVRLTGELIVAKNALAHLARLAARESSPLAAALKSQHAALDHLGGELQRAVLHLRVLPLRGVFQRFPRLLREMSTTLGKPVELRISGEDTEADKAIVEMLFEPLLHVVRNALDHGIEAPPVRASHGKPAVATLELRATRQADQVLVEVSDDGGGFDVERIREVARARGLLAPEVLDAMTDAEAMQLVFAPGFSTVADVTALSGRGVGMDAVRTAVERLGGRVTLESTPGLGATVRFLLPFSVMLSTVMSLAAGGQMFGVPLESVVETLRVPAERMAGVGAARALVVRDRTLAVVDLAQLLGGPAADAVADTGADADADARWATIVVCEFAGQQCGLLVDAVGERLEIILKPLEGLLAGTPGIAGTTLTGDGRVLLVLDVGELLQ